MKKKDASLRYIFLLKKIYATHAFSFDDVAPHAHHYYCKRIQPRITTSRSMFFQYTNS